MAKRKKKTTRIKVKLRLSKEVLENIDHFFTCFPPKHFSRNLRNMIVDLMEAHDGTEPMYLHELLMQLSMFFPVLDSIEDEGKYHSDDYERNRKYY